MRSMSGRALMAVFGIVALFAAACNNGNDDVAESLPEENAVPGDPTEDFVEGEFHECAEGLPLPEGVSVMQSGLAQDPTQGIDSCMTIAQSADSLEDVDAAYRAAFEADGWTFTIEDIQGDEVLRLEAPECGFFTVLPGELMGMGAEGAQEELPETVALIQLMDCEQMPPPADEMPPPEQP